MPDPDQFEPSPSATAISPASRFTTGSENVIVTTNESLVGWIASLAMDSTVGGTVSVTMASTVALRAASPPSATAATW